MSYPPLKRNGIPVKWNTTDESHPSPHPNYRDDEILLKPDQFSSAQEHQRFERDARGYLKSIRGIPRSESQQLHPRATSAAERLAHQRKLQREAKQAAAAKRFVSPE